MQETGICGTVFPLDWADCRCVSKKQVCVTKFSLLLFCVVVQFGLHPPETTCLTICLLIRGCSAMNIVRDTGLQNVIKERYSSIINCTNFILSLSIAGSFQREQWKEGEMRALSHDQCEKLICLPALRRKPGTIRLFVLIIYKVLTARWDPVTNLPTSHHPVKVDLACCHLQFFHADSSSVCSEKFSRQSALKAWTLHFCCVLLVDVCHNVVLSAAKPSSPPGCFSGFPIFQVSTLLPSHL